MLRLAFFTGLTSSDCNWMLHEQRTGSLHTIHTMQDFFFNSFVQETPMRQVQAKLEMKQYKPVLAYHTSLTIVALLPK